MEDRDAPKPELVTVVAAVLRRGAAVLVARRPASKRHGGLWEFPGGKVHPGESPFRALERELREELDVRLVAMDDALFEVQDRGAPFLIRFHPVRIAGEPRPVEHPEIRWVEIGALAGLSLAPADERFVREELEPP